MSDVSGMGPLKDVGNRLQPPSQTGQKAAWKLTIGSWAASSAKQGGLDSLGGDRTPPLFDVSFSACPEEQCVPALLSHRPLVRVLFLMASRGLLAAISLSLVYKVRRAVRSPAAMTSAIFREPGIMFIW